jgi:cell division protein FtsZ
VIHALEEDKPFEQDLSKKEQAPAIITPNIELEEKTETPVVKHTLDLGELEEFKSPNNISNENELIPTSELIRNINVVYDEVLDSVEEEDFVITEIQSETKEDISFEAEEEEQQITLTFDMPISESTIENKDDDFVVHDLEENIKKIPVNDYVELIPVTETNEHGETRYALDDYIEIESGINKNKKQEQTLEIEEELDKEIVFEKKIVNQETSETETEEIDPMNTPISELLKERAEERRRKMKDFNYKFNNSKIDDIEKIPAYKRQGINLDETQHSSESNMSGTSVSTDDNDDLQIRSNNSFLHDNVD